MKILVTGGSGWIGSNLVKHLENKGHRVFSYDIAEGKDITNFWVLCGFFDVGNFDAVYHLAAQAFLSPGEQDPYRDIKINIFGMVNLLRCLEDFDIPMVYTSSGAVYGVTPVIPHREDAVCHPVSNYGVSKLAAEKYLQKWVATKNINAKIVRFSSVYGVGRKHGPVNIFIEKALKGKPLTIYGRGTRTRDLIHVTDAIHGLEVVMEKGERGEIYNIGLGEEHSVAEVAEIVQRHIDIPITYQEYEFAPFDLKRSYYDISKARRIGYMPKIDLESGIKLTILGMKKWV